jgi:hypothetical protein
MSRQGRGLAILLLAAGLSGLGPAAAQVAVRGDQEADNPISRLACMLQHGGQAEKCSEPPKS